MSYSPSVSTSSNRPPDPARGSVSIIDDDALRERTRRAAKRWSVAAWIFCGISQAMISVLACLLIVTMGVAMFLFPAILPGFLAGWLCARRARTLELRLGEPSSATKTALTFGRVGTAAGVLFTCLALMVVLVIKLGR